MTTAARAPRKLYLFGAETADSFLPGDVLDAVAAPDHVRQGPYYVVAATKVAALAHLSAVGMHPRAASLRRVGAVAATDHGNALNAVRDAGFLAADGEIVAWAERAKDGSVAGIARISPTGVDTVGPERRIVEIVAEWQLVVFVGDGPHRHVRFVVRHADGARFPERRRDETPTPATGYMGEPGQVVTR